MNNLQDTINMQEIVELGKLLHENGDKILNALSKLSLSTSLLHNLNEAFSLIVDEPADLDASFHVCNSSKIDIFRDLKFLHDFVQKTVGLKVTYNQNNLETPVVDITKFRHLKYLELKKVNIDCVKGLQGVRGQLESIICVGRKGVHNVSQLLASCGSDAGIGFVWGSLKHLTLSHNGLERLDTSLELAPWLQILDLSYNLISSADELCCLPNLKYVNLGYNKLEVIPIINKTATYTLRVLVLKNNYIENLNGIQNLECLTELDVSYNCLMEHSTLWPLGKMCTLLWISLEGNPLSYHPKHRLLSMKYLHPSLSNSKFVLDHLPLSRSEQKIVADNRPFTIRSEHSVSSEILGSMSDSINSSTLSTFTNSLTIGQNIAGQSTKGTGRMETDLFKSKRRSTIKEAIIVEAEYEKKELVVESDICSSYLETSKDHLETKKQILAVRERYGEDDWLSNNAGTFVQDIMGLHSLSYPELTLESAVKDLDTNIMQNPPDSAMFLMSNVQLEINENYESLIKENSTVNCEKEDVNEVLNEKENVLNESVDSDTHTAVINVLDHMYDPEEETGDLYLVQRKKYNNEIEDLFLIITSDNIKERDAITGKLKCSWSTSSVLSCVLGRSEPITVDIIFDTTREERQNRRYLVEPDIAKKIVQIIGQQMQKRMISLKVFKCMKCSTHFSQDSEYIFIMSSTSVTQQLKCPTCRSTLVIETDELSTLDVESDTSEPCSEWLTKNQCLENKVKANLQHSDSFSSIGGTEGGAISVTTSLVHSNSHTQAQVCCSAMSLEESRESTPSTNVLNKKYESDIEILSNPSQSSIEVLDDASRNLTPHRKRSSEERRTAVAPSLLTIPDAAPIATGLTESSSSGSLTDSICTAYENKIIKQTTADDKSLSTSDKETRFTPVTNLTSMLGGLLQSITIGSNKSSMLKSEEAPNFFSTNIQYSYTDFSSIDHRIKLHIILNICEHENEELILLLRAEILLQNTKDTFPGCLVLSTSKVYVLKITGPEGEDPQRWLHKEVSWTIDRLRRFSPIPFKQGIVIEIDQPNKMHDEFDSTITFLCILQDFQRTVNFLFYITDFLLQPLCEEVEFVVPEHYTMLMHQLVKNCKDYQDGDAVRQLALFSSAILKYQDLEVVLKTSSLIVTASVLVICNIQWFLPGNNETPQIIREQSMSNLIGVDNYNSTLTLNFLDEIAGQEETWTLDFVSVGAAEIVIASVRSPWEELFSIPLQNTVCKLQVNTGT